MMEIYNIAMLIVGSIAVGLVAEVARALIWCSVAWLMFKKWFPWRNTE